MKISIGKSVVAMFNRLRAWFCSIDLRDINIFNSYKTELIVVCSTLEELGKMARNNTEKNGIKLMKRIIKNRTKHAGLEEKFDKFLDKNVRKKE